MDFLRTMGMTHGTLDNYRTTMSFFKSSQVFSQSANVFLRRGKFMAIVVSDFRNKSRYVMFHSDLAQALETIGLQMRGLKVLYQRHKKVYPYGYPYSYVPNIHHQYILILQRPKAEQ